MCALGKCPRPSFHERCGLNDDCAIHVANCERRWRVSSRTNRRGRDFDSTPRSGDCPARAGCRALDLTHNCLGDALCDHVASALSADQHLLALNLSHNRISAKGAQHFASVLVDHHRKATLYCGSVWKAAKGLSDLRTNLESTRTEEKESTTSMAEADAAANSSSSAGCATRRPHPRRNYSCNSQKPPRQNRRRSSSEVGHMHLLNDSSPEELDACLKVSARRGGCEKPSGNCCTTTAKALRRIRIVMNGPPP